MKILPAIVFAYTFLINLVNSQNSTLINGLITNTTCGNSSYCIYGTCASVRSGQCSCYYGYSTIPKNNTIFQCDYPQKKQLIALVLEGILMFGIGHFYIGKYMTASVKFLIFSICASLIVLLRIQSRDKEEYNKISMIIAKFGCLFCCIVISWQVLDIILFALNKYTDNYGIPLLSFGANNN